MPIMGFSIFKATGVFKNYTPIGLPFFKLNWRKLKKRELVVYLSKSKLAPAVS